MLLRDLRHKLNEVKEYYPAIYVTGPRQSGKTTLVRETFTDLEYVLLETPDIRKRAAADPKLFLEQYPNGAILDEVQRVPELFSYLQGVLDANEDAIFVLTGSQNFLISEKITQSLAGRVAVLTLLPFSIQELQAENTAPKEWDEYVFKGSYPRLYKNKIPPHIFYNDYLQTYVERDVRSLKNIGDLRSFDRFLRLCAGRIGQLVNYDSLATDVGVSTNTIKSWISVLETSYVLYTLPPFYNNYSKRLIKSPKIYFYDTGLASHLLGIRSKEELQTHYLKGGLFENYVVNEVKKYFYNRAENRGLYFFRDNNGRELDLLIDYANEVKAIEIKSGKTYHREFFKNLKWWQKLTEDKAENSFLVHGGDDTAMLPHGKLVAWNGFLDILKTEQ